MDSRKTITSRLSAMQSRRLALLRGRLIEKRRKLLEDLAGGLSAAMETIPIPSDFADMAYLTTEQDVSFRLGSYESDIVARIDRALERLEEGTYGICEQCNKQIPKARLRAIPFASLCIPCQQTFEQETGTQEGFLFSSDESQDFTQEHLPDDEQTNMAVIRGRRVA